MPLPAFIAPVLSGAASFFGKVLGGAKEYVVLYLARRSGRSAERSDQRKEANRIKREQLDAASKRPLSRDEIIEEFKKDNL